MTIDELGVLGALPYVGLTLSSSMWGRLLQQKSPRQVVSVGLFCNMLAVALMAISPDVELVAPGRAKWCLIVSKLLIGFTQAGSVVYGPVWVDEFAPEGLGGIWMGSLQGGAALGVMAGYAVTGAIFFGPCNE